MSEILTIPNCIYRTPLSNWTSKATVRCKPHRLIDESSPEEGFFFPPALAPTCSHHLIAHHGQEMVQELLIKRLYAYLNFTSILEHHAVNPVLLDITSNDMGLTLPSGMRFDAYKIYCDEAYHALFSTDLKRQIESLTGVVDTVVAMPAFMIKLRHIQSTVPKSLERLVMLCFAVVSETLISATLSSIPQDSSVVRVVREVVADHAQDERRHHAYFIKLMELVWPQLSTNERRVLGPLFPTFIMSFLEPDYTALQLILRRCISIETAQELIQECHPRAIVVRDAKEAARATMRLLARMGVLDDHRTEAAFQEAGLLG